MLVVGIDPGLTGAIGVVGDELRVTDMPVRTLRSGRSVCPHGIADVMRGIAMHAGTLQVYVESSSARPGQGVSSTCNTCRGAGLIEGVLAALDIRYTLVPASAWKRNLGLLGAPKQASRSRAMQLFPGLSDQLTRVKDHGRAEALLIAEYGLRR